MTQEKEVKQPKNKRTGLVRKLERTQRKVG